ncbi:MAG: serine/threonine-protein kinase, partial [Candidatus Eremiobacterota bacterium]
MDPDQTLFQSPDEQEERRRVSAATPPDIHGYELASLLGSGSFGEVWAATQIRTGQKVAVKILSRARGLDWLYFRNELERLREVALHPGVATLLDADLTGEPPYFVMPWLRRGSLAGLVERPATDQVLGWFRQIAGALQYTHSKGILHCDVKPSNILLDEEGHARLVDFGQSRRKGESRALGTLGYMAPEQASSSETDTPSVQWDVYGLGATVYDLLTGQVPRLSPEDRSELSTTASSRVEQYRKLLAERPLVPIRALNPQVDAELAAIVESCVELDPERRPASISQVLQDLDHRERGEPLLCRRPWSLRYRVDRLMQRREVRLAVLFVITVCLLLGTHLYSYVKGVYDERYEAALLFAARGQASEQLGDRDAARLCWAVAADRLEGHPSGSTLRHNLQVMLRCHPGFPLAWRTRLPDRPRRAAFSPDGRRLAVADISGVSLLDTAGGANLARVLRPGVRVVACGSDRLLTAGEAVELWDHRGKLVAALEHGGETVIEAGFGPDGVLRTVTPTGLREWDAGTGRWLGQVHALGPASEARLTRQGCLLLDAERSEVGLWARDTGLRALARSNPGQIQQIAAAGDRAACIMRSPGSGEARVEWGPLRLTVS